MQDGLRNEFPYGKCQTVSAKLRIMNLKKVLDKMPQYLFLCAPGGARFLRVQVPNPPGSGKDIAEGKGVHREVESEGSRMWGTY